MDEDALRHCAHAPLIAVATAQPAAPPAARRFTRRLDDTSSEEESERRGARSPPARRVQASVQGHSPARSAARAPAPLPTRLPRARAPTAKRQLAADDAAAALEAKKARTEAAAARARQPPVERLSVAQQLVDRHATISAQLDEARGLRTRLAAFEHVELDLHGIPDGGVRADVDGIVDEANGALAAHYAVDDEGEAIVLEPCDPKKFTAAERCIMLRNLRNKLLRASERWTNVLAGLALRIDALHKCVRGVGVQAQHRASRSAQLAVLHPDPMVHQAYDEYAQSEHKIGARGAARARC